ncbi:uncharacterized protein LY89DRAFT_679406, partial [Mollisia scopiformis]
MRVSAPSSVVFHALMLYSTPQPRTLGDLVSPTILLLSCTNQSRSSRLIILLLSRNSVWVARMQSLWVAAPIIVTPPLIFVRTSLIDRYVKISDLDSRHMIPRLSQSSSIREGFGGFCLPAG